jgi:hypothetical protein
VAGRLLFDRWLRAMLSGRMMLHSVRVAIGDRVRAQISSYDPDRGRINVAERPAPRGTPHEAPATVLR